MSRAKSIGNVYAELSVRDKMTMGLAKAGKSLSKFGKQATRYAGAGLAAGTAAAGVALIAGTKRTLDMTDAVGDLAAQTGISVSGMMKMQQVYKDGGRSAEMASKDIGKMQKSIVTAAEGAVEDDPFAKIGLSARELIELAPEKQFKMIGDALMRIENPALRNARAMEIFGKGGAGLASVFGNAEKSVKSLGRMPELAEQFADRMGEANDIIGRLPVKSDQFFMGFTAGIIDEMLPALRQADEMDFTTLGENIGNSIGHGFSALTDGTLLDVVGLKVLAWATDSGNAIANAFESAFETVKNKGSNVWDDLQAGVDIMLGNEAGMKLHDKSISERANQKSFSESFSEKQKNSKGAGDQMRTIADDLWNSSKIENAVGEGIYSTMRKSGEDTGLNMMPEEEKAKSRSWEESSAQVSSLQSRGLSYGAAEVSNVVKQQSDNVKMIYEALKAAISKGDVIFT